MEINFNEIMESVTQLADNAVQLAKDVASKASKKTGDIVGASKVRMDKLKIEGEIKSAYQKLGAAVYDMAVKDCKDTQLIDQYVAEITTKKEQVVQLEKQLAALKKTVICEECKAVNPKDAFFCSRCGAPLPTTEPEAECEECCEEPCEEPTAEEVIEQAEVDGADEATAEQVAEEAQSEEKPEE